MKTVASGARRANADWPYHSTCMGFLLDRLRAAQPRRARRDEAGGDREDERGMQPAVKRAGDELREERVTGQRRLVGRWQGVERVRPHELRDRVVAEERCEQDR